MHIQNNISLKKKLKKGEFVIGTWCEIPSPEVVNILAKAGLDFVIIDMEHGSMDFTTASRMIMAAEVESCSPIIRVSRNDESDILRALEIAPEGIIVPHIESVEDRISAINYLKFWPVGSRSLNPYTRAGGYTVTPNFTKKQNKSMLSCLIIEGEKGILDIEKIIDDEEIDIVYLGTYDISMALGVHGDTKNIKVVKTLEKLVKIIRNKKKFAGCLFHTEQELNSFKKMGIQFLCYKVDAGVIFDTFNKIVSK